MRIYIAGAYTSPDPAIVRENVERAIEAGRQVYLKGHIPIVPHVTHYLHTEWLKQGTDAPYGFWVRLGLYQLHHCEALLLLPNWSQSKGARVEFAEAIEMEIPIYFDVEDVPDED